MNEDLITKSQRKILPSKYDSIIKQRSTHLALVPSPTNPSVKRWQMLSGQNKLGQKRMVQARQVSDQTAQKIREGEWINLTLSGKTVKAKVVRTGDKLLAFKTKDGRKGTVLVGGVKKASPPPLKSQERSSILSRNGFLNKNRKEKKIEKSYTPVAALLSVRSLRIIDQGKRFRLGIPNCKSSLIKTTSVNEFAFDKLVDMRLISSNLKRGLVFHNKVATKDEMHKSRYDAGLNWFVMEVMKPWMPRETSPLN